MSRIAIVASAEITVRAFLIGHISALAQKHDVTVLVNTHHPHFLHETGLDVRVIPVGVERPIRPMADVRALRQLYRVMRAERFDLVYSVTPKVGLLAMLAGRLARVPVRIHTFTGQVWATRKGSSRALLKRLDGAIAQFATHVLADSSSQRDFLVDEGVVAAHRIGVLAKGSISGVDVNRFKPNAEARREVRGELNIPLEHEVLVFVGRLNRDKGLLDLAQAFQLIAAERDTAHLLFVGPDEEGMADAIRGITSSVGDRVHFVPFTTTPERYMAAADVYCLPSYREGFGSALLEAASVGVPGIASRIYGIVDAIDDGVTGVLHEPRNPLSLADAARSVLRDAARREAMGRAARARVLRDFHADVVTSALVEYIDGALGV